MILSEKIYRFFIRHYPLKTYDTNQLNTDTLAKIQFPYAILKRNSWVPLSMKDGHLTLGVSNPELCDLSYQLAIQLNKKITMVLIPHTNCQLLHHRLCSQFIYKQYGLQSKETGSVEPLFKQLMHDALFYDASDIHIEPQQQSIRIRLRIQGVLTTASNIHISFSSQLINYIKVQSGLDTTQTKLPQDGNLRYSTNKNQWIDCRVNVYPFHHAGIIREKCVIRLLKGNHKILDFNQLGMPEIMLQPFKKKLHQPQGLILVTGPTGSGKTNTLYTALNYLNTEQKNIATIEDPVEMSLTNIYQTATHHAIGLTFATCLRSLLRQDPDILMIGEIRDSETADVALHASQTGHLVLATLHTNSACQTITRLHNLGLPAYQLAECLHLIIAQRLLRKLCPICKIKSDCPTHNEKKTYQAGPGCLHCHLGYTGRTGVFEQLVCDMKIKKGIIDKLHSKTLEKIAMTNGFLPLTNQADKLIQTGITSQQEANRVIGVD